MKRPMGSIPSAKKREKDLKSFGWGQRFMKTVWLFFHSIVNLSYTKNIITGFTMKG